MVRNSGCLLFADDLKLYAALRDFEECKRLWENVDPYLRPNGAETTNYFSILINATMSCTRALNPCLNECTIGGDLGLHFSKDLTLCERIIFIKKLKNI